MGSPAVCLQRVIGDAAGRHSRGERLALKLVEREIVPCLVSIVESAHVHYHAGRNLELDIVAVVNSFVFHILVGVCYSTHVGRRNDVIT